jgi:thiol-disulfide isomerase/thioredoxin
MTVLVTVTDLTFAKHVLDAPMPVLVLFGKRTCRASQALATSLGMIMERYAGQLRIVKVNVDTATVSTDRYNARATPTLLVLQQGKVATRVVGFLPEGLLRVLCEQVVSGKFANESVWSPTEEVFESAVIIPLLQRSGFHHERQVACTLPGRTRQDRGRADLLVYDHPQAHPLTLFEIKRRITSSQELLDAVTQAHAYARAFWLRSFVVAAPAGIWIYARTAAQPTCVRQMSSLQVQQQEAIIPKLLLQLAQ